jgi:hypothetical protein
VGLVRCGVKPFERPFYPGFFTPSLPWERVGMRAGGGGIGRADRSPPALAQREREQERIKKAARAVLGA